MIIFRRPTKLGRSPECKSWQTLTQCEYYRCPFTDTKQQPAKQGRDLHKNSGGPRANDVQAKGLHEVYSNLNYHNFKLKKTFLKTNKSTLFLK